MRPPLRFESVCDCTVQHQVKRDHEHRTLPHGSGPVRAVSRKVGERRLQFLVADISLQLSRTRHQLANINTMCVGGLVIGRCCRGMNLICFSCFRKELWGDLHGPVWRSTA